MITNLNDLPTTTNVNENILIEQQQYQPVIQNEPKPVLLDPNTISQIVHELHQATLSGATKLQSRDVPQMPIEVPNNNNNNNDIVHPQSYYVDKPPISSSSSSSLAFAIDYYYHEFQIPIALGLLFFLFQLFSSNRYLRKYVSFLFLDNGAIRKEGNILLSILFAIVYYVYQKYCYYE